MACAQLPGSTLLKNILDVLLGLACLRHYSRCPTLFDYFLALWPCTGACISPVAIFRGLLFKIAVRSERHCTLVAVFLDAFFTAFNFRRTHRGPGLNFKEFTYGRIKMMTALCPAWAHTPTRRCAWDLTLNNFKQEAFLLPKRKNVFYVTNLPNYYQNDWN